MIEYYQTKSKAFGYDFFGFLICNYCNVQRKILLFAMWNYHRFLSSHWISGFKSLIYIHLSHPWNACEKELRMRTFESVYSDPCRKNFKYSKEIRCEMSALLWIQAAAFKILEMLEKNGNQNRLSYCENILIFVPI